LVDRVPGRGRGCGKVMDDIAERYSFGRSIDRAFPTKLCGGAVRACVTKLSRRAPDLVHIALACDKSSQQQARLLYMYSIA
jgi:hypothetical protein